MRQCIVLLHFPTLHQPPATAAGRRRLRDGSADAFNATARHFAPPEVVRPLCLIRGVSLRPRIAHPCGVMAGKSLSAPTPTPQHSRAWTADELQDEHLRLLYLISKYTTQTRWVRELPLLVLIFEGIRAGIFTYDYAPAAVTVCGRIVFMNISQEGRDDVDDLREAGLLASLKLTAHNGTTSTAVQPSAAGWAFLEERVKQVRNGDTRCLLDRHRAILCCSSAGQISQPRPSTSLSPFCSPHPPPTHTDLPHPCSPRCYAVGPSAAG
eukprot:COSAG01_NODE_768_length_13739_cov_6.271334_18_plen_267_part_00